MRTTVFDAGPYRDLADVEHSTTGWVDWYNHECLHGSLGVMTPVEFKEHHYMTLNRET